MASTNGVITKSSSINPYIKKQISAADSVKPACSRTNLAPRNPYSKSSSSVPTLSNPQPSQTTSNEAPFPPIRKNNPYLSRKYPREYSQPSTTGSTLLLTTASQQIEIVECNEFSHSAPSGSSTSLERDAIAVKAPSLKSKEYHQTCSRIGSLEVPNSSASLSNSSLVASRMKPSIASLRPSSWTLTNSCPSQSTPIHVEPSTQSITTNRPELPGEIALPPELVYDPESIKPIKDEYRNKLTINARLNQPLLNGWTLYRHQKRAILKGLMKRRVILALDMGLGKTLIGCVWARAFKKSFDGLKIIVVCPVTLKKEWKRTAEEATGLSVEDEKHAANDSLDMAIATWAKIPLAVDPAIANFVAIFDEAHAMQSMEANRTQAALKLVFEKRCVGVLLLTGTPMKNGKPCNLFPLLKAVRHPLGLHQKAFERHFCQGRMASLGGRAPQWIASGQANLKQLHRLIEPSLLHMTKDEYLNELPPMKRETREVPINARYQKQYKEKVKNMASLQAAMKTNMDLNNKALMGATQEL